MTIRAGNDMFSGNKAGEIISSAVNADATYPLLTPKRRIKEVSYGAKD